MQQVIKITNQNQVIGVNYTDEKGEVAIEGYEIIIDHCC